MRRASVIRLSLLLFILAFGVMSAPSQAFPYCPPDSCGDYALSCQENGGTPSVSYNRGLCQDENFYLRSFGVAYCTYSGWTDQQGECASY
jgi:hypothetical protein